MPRMRHPPPDTPSAAAVGSSFQARLRRPGESGEGPSWAFIVLPPEVSARLPRRGRLTIAGTLNGQQFQALLEPDGRKSHWLRLDHALLRAAGARVGDDVRFEIAPLEPEPEPDLPSDFAAALHATPRAKSTWDATTTVARLDWIHWLDSAKQASTRSKRIGDACAMLAAGKKRVCCFDPSGYYSKAFCAPQAED